MVLPDWERGLPMALWEGRSPYEQTDMSENITIL